MWVKSITGKTIGDIRGRRIVIQYSKARGGYTVWIRGSEAEFPTYKALDQAMQDAELWAQLHPGFPEPSLVFTNRRPEEEIQTVI